MELKNLELKRQLAEAQLETIRASGQAQIKASEMQAAVAQEQAYAIRQQSSINLMLQGLSMLNPPRSAPPPPASMRLQTRCFYTGQILNCR